MLCTAVQGRDRQRRAAGGNDRGLWELSSSGAGGWFDEVDADNALVGLGRVDTLAQGPDQGRGGVAIGGEG
jgi:hypothetical protein